MVLWELLMVLLVLMVFGAKVQSESAYFLRHAVVRDALWSALCCGHQEPRGKEHAGPAGRHCSDLEGVSPASRPLPASLQAPSKANPCWLQAAIGVRSVQGLVV